MGKLTRADGLLLVVQKFIEANRALIDNGGIFCFVESGKWYEVSRDGNMVSIEAYDWVRDNPRFRVVARDFDKTKTRYKRGTIEQCFLVDIAAYTAAWRNIILPRFSHYLYKRLPVYRLCCFFCESSGPECGKKCEDSKRHKCTIKHRLAKKGFEDEMAGLWQLNTDCVAHILSYLAI